MTTEVQTPIAGIHRANISKFQRLPSTGCLSLQQLRELYPQQRPGSANASPVSSPQASPSSSPMRSRSQKSQVSRSSLSLPSATQPTQNSTGASSRLRRQSAGTPFLRCASECSREDLSAAERDVAAAAAAAPCAPERVDSTTLGALSAAIDAADRSRGSGSATSETHQRAKVAFYKSQSLHCDRLAALKSSLAQEKALRHARSMERRVSFCSEVEVIVYS